MKRLPKWLKYTLLGSGALVGTGLIAAAVANADASARLERKMAELRAAGQPLSLIELKRQPIPPETNAATYLARAKSDLLAIQKEVGAAEDAAEEAAKKAGQPVDDGEGFPSPAILAAMRAALAAYPNALPLLVQASQCPDYDAQFDYSTGTETFIKNLLPNFRVTRAAFRALNYRALVALADGKPDDALQSCLTMFRLARHVDRNPMIVNYLMALAVRGVAISATNMVLRSGLLPPDAYDALEVELVRQDLITAYRHSLRTERAFGMQAFAELFAPKLVAVGGFLPGFKNAEADYLEFFDILIESADRPYSDPNAHAKTAALAASAGVLTQLLLPAVQAQQNATARVLARLRALRVLNAILRIEHSGKTVEPTLENLGLPADVTTDPYNGEPLHLKTTPQGWVIYSVGVDYKDGGGTKLGGGSDEDAGVGPVPGIPSAGKAKTEE